MLLVFFAGANAWTGGPTNSGGNTATGGVADPVPFGSGANSDIKPGSSSSRARSLVDPVFEACGQDCLYGKARENLTLQIEYVLKKRAYVRSGSDSHRKELLGSFCGPQESSDDCAKRYDKLVDFWLVKARGAIGSQEVAIATLKCSDFNPDGSCKGVHGTAHFQMQVEGSKLAQTQYFAKSMDMGMASGSLQNITDNATWENNLANSYEPVLEDFIKFKKIPGSDGNMMEVPVRDDEGKLTFDGVACQRAHAAWEGSGKGRPCPSREEKEKLGNQAGGAKSKGGAVAGVVGTTPGAGSQSKSVTGIHEWLHETTQGQDLKKEQEQSRRDFQVEFSNNTSIPNRGLSRIVYDAARGNLINSLNGEIDLTNKKKLQKQPPRDPNAKGKPQPTPTPSYIPADQYTGKEELKTKGPSENNTRFQILHHASDVRVRPDPDQNGQTPPSTQGLSGVSDDNEEGKIDVFF